MEFQTSNCTPCADQLAQTAVMRLYDWGPFATFLVAPMQHAALYTMEDPLTPRDAMSYGPTDSLNSHFDRSEFTTTLLLQASETGGDFAYRTDLRTQTDAKHDAVTHLLAGRDPEMKEMTLVPGTLNVFRGKNTAHRVTPVIGDKTRIIAVFSFYDRPGVQFSAQEQIGFYGRAS